MDKSVKQYKILQKIGHGGMGVIFQAEDLRLHRLVALKFLPNDLTRDEEAKARFMQEARAASGLDHPNVCTVYEIGEAEDGQLFISMAYCEGQTLREKIAAGPLPLDEACHLIQQIGEGLAAAHEKGIIHRDLKPENIIVKPDGVIKIVDFGLAKLSGKSQLTLPGTTLGTVAYMSPEQAQSAEVDERTDIWALGVIFYELLTGKQPFDGEYHQAIIYSIINAEPAPIEEVRQDVPEAVLRIVQKALTKAPQARYLHVTDLLEDLRTMQAPQTGTRHTQQRVHPPKPAKARRTLSVAGIALLLGLILLGWFFFNQSPADAPGNSIISIAVLPFDLKGVGQGQTWLGVGMAEFVTTQLSQYKSIRVLDIQQQMGIMRKLHLSSLQAYRTRAIESIREAGISHLVAGKVILDGPKVTLRADLVDVGTGGLIAHLNPVVGDTTTILALADQVAAELVKQLKLPSPQGAAASVDVLQSSASLEAQRYYMEGLDAAYNLRYDKSIEKLKRAIALDSTFIKPYYFLAWQYQNTGQYAKARRMMTKGKPYLQFLSEESRLQFLCNEASLDGRWQDYVGYLEKLIKLKPQSASLHSNYGWVLYRKFRMFDAAISALRKAIELDSTYAFAYNTLAFAYLGKGAVQEAMKTIDEGIARNPADINLFDSKAKILLLSGRYEEAQKICQRILRLAPKLKSPPLHMSRIDLEKGRFTHAIESMKQYLQKKPTPYFASMALTLQANGFFQLGKYRQARNVLKRALVLDKGKLNLEARWLLGLTHLKMRRYDSAMADLDSLRQVLAAQESLENIWYEHHLKGAIALSQKHYGQAIEAYQEAVQSLPLNRAFYLAELAGGYATAHQWAEAVEQYRLAAAINPNLLQVALGMARASENLGNLKEAAVWYRKYLKLAETGEWQEEDLRFAREKVATLNQASKNL
ncbi:MAG: hypothetical protein D6814_16990 [Calditrichaeota bacterium]|nr:MAG: hypothetical protein D6814_16990 [Calditrichota bacterium]